MIETQEILSTKAETLERLKPLLKKAVVLDLIYFTIDDWENDPNKIRALISKKNWSDKPLVVRSSAKSEDCKTQSNAGGYKSVLDVRGEARIDAAISKVIDSFGEKRQRDDQILIQPMLESVSMAGVIFTADLDTLAPYYIVSYDPRGSTESVTSGETSKIKTYIYFKNAPLQAQDPILKKLFEACNECERVTKCSLLDIEFAFDTQATLFILQVRPIVEKNKNDLRERFDLTIALDKLHRKINKLSIKHPNLLGQRSIYGVMPDWNPAEIIGLKPRPMALSIYKELITDNIWAYQRNNYGYRNLRSHPLLISFYGIPYIDVRVSFNSFIPRDLHESIAEKLVDYYLDQLESVPEYHDKVEFEIVHSCYYLNLPQKLSKLLGFGFNQNEIKRIEFSLLKLTNYIINSENGLYKKDLKKIEILKQKYSQVLESDLSLVDKIYWLVEDCKRYGTLPFAGIARAAFIAVQYLKSFVELEILTQDEYDLFMNSLQTVSKELSQDLKSIGKNIENRQSFLDKYGHLRPGTYDILSSRYDENFENYFSIPKEQISVYSKTDDTTIYRFSSIQMEHIEQLLIEHGINIDAEGLVQFIRKAIEGREYAKFIFTRSLSRILQLIKMFGEKNNCSKEELSFLNIQSVLDLYSSLNYLDVEEVFKNDIEKNKHFYSYTEAIKLPSLLISPDDIYGFYLEASSPNFITSKQIQAEIITEPEFDDKSFDGKIAFVSSADPGYDFLFTKPIVGLVTKYGGINSHMAIRCAELGLPAVIGSGEQNYQSWRNAGLIFLDCGAHIVRVFR